MSEWISVDDRLPDHSEPVIAATNDYACMGVLVVPARYASGIWRDVDNLDIDGDEQEMWSVTHWMPLPSPPE